MGAMNPRGAGAASKLHGSFAAKDAAQDDIVMGYSIVICETV